VKKKEAVARVESLALTANSPHPRRLRPGIDRPLPPLLVAPVAGEGGDLGPTLSVVKGSLKLEFGHLNRCYGGYNGVVRDKNKVYFPPRPPRRRRSCWWR
jgi:hypothetical protein